MSRNFPQLDNHDLCGTPQNVNKLFAERYNATDTSVGLNCNLDGLFDTDFALFWGDSAEDRWNTHVGNLDNTQTDEDGLIAAGKAVELLEKIKDNDMIYTQVTEDRVNADQATHVFPYRLRFFSDVEHEEEVADGFSVTFNIGCGVSQMAIKVRAFVLDPPVPHIGAGTRTNDEHTNTTRTTRNFVHTSGFIAVIATGAVVLLLMVKFKRQRPAHRDGDADHPSISKEQTALTPVTAQAIV